MRHVSEYRERDSRRRRRHARLWWRLILAFRDDSSRPRSRSKAARRRRSSSFPSTTRRRGERDAQLHVVGQRAVRVDAPDKVTGRARYTVDIVRVGMLHAAILRSRVARGRATLDLGPARAVAGVVEVIATGDLERRIRLSGGALFDTTLSYAGQPLAAVCAESLDAARRGVEAIVVQYETEPHIGTFAAAVADGAPVVRRSSRAPSTADTTRSPNLARTSPDVIERGDIARGLAESAVVVRRTYRTPVALHTALEPHAAVAEWEGDRLTVWESTQAVFAVREQLATGLGSANRRSASSRSTWAGGSARRPRPAHTRSWRHCSPAARGDPCAA